MNVETTQHPSSTASKVVPFSLKDAPSLIEKAWPTFKISAETQKERKAVHGQTLTGLGSYWKGRKPLILTRACVLGALLPATDDVERDVEVFEMLMGFDDQAFGRRFAKSAAEFATHFPDYAPDVATREVLVWREDKVAERRARAEEIVTSAGELAKGDPLLRALGRFARSSSSLAPSADASEFVDRYPFDADLFTCVELRTWRWRKDVALADRQSVIAQAFSQRPYAKRLDLVRRPEEVPEAELLGPVWGEVNAHLSTFARSIDELVEQLGVMRFGRRPRFADTFSGSGSIPFEAARVGCDVHASDLNPIACMLTWGAFHVIGATPEEHKRMVAEQRRIAAEVDQQVSDLRIEHDADGNRAKVYLYCLETRCPRTGWMVPMAPSWVLSRQRHVIARLIPDHEVKRYEIEVVTASSDEEIQEASLGTIRESRLVHPVLGEQLGAEIGEIRGDHQGDDRVNRNALRRLDASDFEPRPEDIFQERLYAIQWMDADDLAKAKTRLKTWLAAPSEADHAREKKVQTIVTENLNRWRAEGFVPDMAIEPGNKTSELIRTRGWTSWHHLFSPRHLLVLALLREEIAQVSDHEVRAALDVAFCRALDFVSKLTQWMTRQKTESSTGGLADVVNHVFYNQAFNPFWNYGARATMPLLTNFTLGKASGVQVRKGRVATARASEPMEVADLWITDPPYADAVQYDEITEYFIAWLRKNPPAPFEEWIWDSRRNLAIKGEGQSFKASMVDAYRAMAEHTTDHGLQIVQFTHQDAKTWSDMAQIFWGAGLQVVQDWYVSTEAASSIKKGGYVQGTHMIVVRKRQGTAAGYSDEIVHEIRDEVERQIKEMTGLNDRMASRRDENIFNDADLQMAGYAAALRVLTAYTKIDGKDMTQEALRPRAKDEKTIVDELTEYAVQTANEFLVPDGIDRGIWIDLNGTERFYLKMLNLEEVGEAKLDQFQNFAKAFRVEDYNDLMASKTANNARLKTAKQLGKGSMGEGVAFGRESLVRLTLRAIWRVSKNDEVEHVLEELRDLIPDYLRKRDILLAVARYVAEKRAATDEDEASAARILATAIQAERI